MMWDVGLETPTNLSLICQPMRRPCECITRQWTDSIELAARFAYSVFIFYIDKRENHSVYKPVFISLPTPDTFKGKVPVPMSVIGRAVFCNRKSAV